MRGGDIAAFVIHCEFKTFYIRWANRPTRREPSLAAVRPPAGSVGASGPGVTVAPHQAGPRRRRSADVFMI